MEIGSEFEWNPSFNQEKTLLSKVFDYLSDVIFTFSGRTAIETVIRNEHRVKKVLFPSYCCKSMMEPFLNNGIAIEFYSVNYGEGLEIDIDISDDVDAVLWCNYFGYNSAMPDFKKFRDRGGIVIEDITHSLLSTVSFHAQVDYVVASLRKWGPFVSGGVCKSFKGPLNVVPGLAVDNSFVSDKSQAMQAKHGYLTGSYNGDKSAFLDLFRITNEWLASNYSNRKIDEISFDLLGKMDFEDIRKRRISNATILHEGLSSVPEINFMFSEDQIDCPLFVPIIVDSGKREAFRAFLIENQVYCPVHWPKAFDIMESNIYDRELSLICDQRYSEVDMLRIVNLIKKFMTKN